MLEAARAAARSRMTASVVIDRAGAPTFDPVTAVDDDADPVVLHRVPTGLAAILVHVGDAFGAEGYFDFPPGASQIRVDPHGANPRFAETHKFGHDLDRRGLGLDEFASEMPGGRTTAGLQAWWIAAHASKAIRAPDTLKLQSLTSRERAQVKYLLDPSEIWARSYSQWIAGHDSALATELARFQADSGIQWDEEGFGPIAEALRASFEKRGWLR
ncbi:MAG TPA: hypothetical protein VHA73_11690 [Acidimicrobiales bacterium]|jgi:hypothetical protein|nr:hypothetical protein [Acidimicrobiales bacterium]